MKQLRYFLFILLTVPTSSMAADTTITCSYGDGGELNVYLSCDFDGKHYYNSTFGLVQDKKTTKLVCVKQCAVIREDVTDCPVGQAPTEKIPACTDRNNPLLYHVKNLRTFETGSAIEQQKECLRELEKNYNTLIALCGVAAYSHGSCNFEMTGIIPCKPVSTPTAVPTQSPSGSPTPARTGTPAASITPRS